MDSLKLDCGDNNNNNNNPISISPRQQEEKLDRAYAQKSMNDTNEINDHKEEKKSILEETTPQMIDDNEVKLKERIAQCRNIIENLKFELNEEKAKIENDSKNFLQAPSESAPNFGSRCNESSTSNNFVGDITYNTNMYSSCVDSKLNCDENLIEYEKQLQKYQNTLNMAHIEKKNAIRKQMLTKAYKLKLLEVENQCNIELIRVKQSLQCLEPLQMIANKWKNNTDEFVYDFNNFELVPRYPELNDNSRSDINCFKEEFDTNTILEKSEINTKDDFH